MLTTKQAYSTMFSLKKNLTNSNLKMHAQLTIVSSNLLQIMVMLLCT